MKDLPLTEPRKFNNKTKASLTVAFNSHVLVLQTNSSNSNSNRSKSIVKTALDKLENETVKSSSMGRLANRPIKSISRL